MKDMKNKNRPLLILLLLLTACPQLYAGSKEPLRVIASGVGITKQDAIKDAIRSGIEQTLGVYVFSTTETENFKLKKDEIIVQVQGSVKKYKVLQEQKLPDGSLMITLEISIDRNVFTPILKKADTLSYDAVLEDAMKVEWAQNRLKESYKLLQALTSQPVSSRYTATFIKYKITDVGLDYVDVDLFVQVSPNDAWWSLYEDVLKAASQKEGNVVCEGPIKGVGFLDTFSEPAKKFIKKSHSYTSSGQYEYSYVLYEKYLKLFLQQYNVHSDLQAVLVHPEKINVVMSVAALPKISESLGAFFNVFSYNLFTISQRSTKLCMLDVKLTDEFYNFNKMSVDKSSKIKKQPFTIRDRQKFSGNEESGNIVRDSASEEEIFWGEPILKFSVRLKDSNDIIRLAKAKFQIK